MKSTRLLLAATAVALALAACQDRSTATASLLEAKSVIGYLPYWDHARGLETIEGHQVFSEISPFWYRLDASGHIGPFDSSGYNDPSIIEALRSKDLRIVPTLANLNDNGWDAAVVSQILNNSELMKGHIDSIVNLVVSKGYDGIDIDYESLYGHDRDAFSRFIAELATALHAHDKTLSVVVYAKTYEPGPSEAKVYDYAALGQAADQVRLMIYNYHWTTSLPGPIAPIHWVERVASFAAGKIPRERLVFGFGLYGIDWVGHQGREIEWQEVLRLVNTYGVEVRWDSTSRSPWFEYTDSSGSDHVVWFENAHSIAHKLDVAERYDVAGVSFWRLGGEHEGTWQEVQSRFFDASATLTPLSFYGYALGE